MRCRSPRRKKDPPARYGGVLAPGATENHAGAEACSRRLNHLGLEDFGPWQWTFGPSSWTFLLPSVFFGWEGSPTKIDYRTKRALIPTSLLEDLASAFLGLEHVSGKQTVWSFLFGLIHSI